MKAAAVMLINPAINSAVRSNNNSWLNCSLVFVVCFQALAVEAFARALRQIPTIIADNAGYDSSELVSQLRAAHYTEKEKCEQGLDMEKGTIGNMRELKILESYKSKLQVVVSAHDAAEMILRVDDIIKCAPRQRKGGHGHGH